MVRTHTCVYLEDTEKTANERLKKLREIDSYAELKVYIIPYQGMYRVYRKVDLSKKIK